MTRTHCWPAVTTAWAPVSIASSIFALAISPDNLLLKKIFQSFVDVGRVQMELFFINVVMAIMAGQLTVNGYVKIRVHRARL
jgi:hypothetical protein